jgi:hypothetical protein
MSEMPLATVHLVTPRGVNVVVTDMALSAAASTTTAQLVWRRQHDAGHVTGGADTAIR